LLGLFAFNEGRCLGLPVKVVSRVIELVLYLLVQAFLATRTAGGKLNSTQRVGSTNMPGKRFTSQTIRVGPGNRGSIGELTITLHDETSLNNGVFQCACIPLERPHAPPLSAEHEPDVQTSKGGQNRIDSGLATRVNTKRGPRLFGGQNDTAPLCAVHVQSTTSLEQLLLAFKL
jgi:hypothetical protein